MDYKNYRPDWNKPSIFTAQQYGTKVSVEVERSDMDLDEVMDALQTLIIGLGYHQDAFKNWVIDRADEYREEEETEKNMGIYEPSPELKKAVEDYVATLEQDEERYRATDEDESEFDDYGKRIEKDRVSFEWGDEPEEDYDGQFEDWENETPPLEDDLELKEGYKKYKKALKTLSAKQKKKSKF